MSTKAAEVTSRRTSTRAVPMIFLVGEPPPMGDEPPKSRRLDIWAAGGTWRGAGRGVTERRAGRRRRSARGTRNRRPDPSGLHDTHLLPGRPAAPPPRRTELAGRGAGSERSGTLAR